MGRPRDRWTEGAWRRGLQEWGLGKVVWRVTRIALGAAAYWKLHDAPSSSAPAAWIAPMLPEWWSPFWTGLSVFLLLEVISLAWAVIRAMQAQRDEAREWKSERDGDPASRALVRLRRTMIPARGADSSGDKTALALLRIYQDLLTRGSPLGPQETERTGPGGFRPDRNAMIRAWTRSRVIERWQPNREAVQYLLSPLGCEVLDRLEEELDEEEGQSSD